MTEPSNHPIALLVMVHGSPNAEANGPVRDVVDMVRRRGAYDFVAIGHMECNEPSIPAAIDECVASGARRIDAVPYFLHVGAHVAEDLPELLAQAGVQHPGVTIRLGPYIGQSARVGDVLAERADESLRTGQ